MTKKFKPIQTKLHLAQLSIRIEPGDRKKIDAAAAKFGVTKQAFVQQAIMYAIENMEST